MKVGFKFGMPGYTGKLDGLVYYYDKAAGMVYARKWVYPQQTKENERIGSISSKVFAIKPSKAYKANLRLYVLRYNSLKPSGYKPVRSWVNIYLMMMYNMAKLMPNVDLHTITKSRFT